MQRTERRALKGVVIGNKMNKTVVVQVERTERHAKYGKVIARKSKLYAHVDGEMPAVGTAVEIMETRPISKLKSWRVVDSV
jgi:small subunit ribosomal protein S17